MLLFTHAINTYSNSGECGRVMRDVLAIGAPLGADACVGRTGCAEGFLAGKACWTEAELTLAGQLDVGYPISQYNQLHDHVMCDYVMDFLPLFDETKLLPRS